jgi:predicted nucleic acid-binding protein
MALVLFDTNILIDSFNGIQEAFDELDYYPDAAISAITWMEVIAGTPPADLPKIRQFLTATGFAVIQTDEAIMNEAAAIRGASIRIPPKIALPDAIIMATGNVTNRLVITRNKKDFRGLNVRIPYELETTNVVKVVNVIPLPPLSA